MNQISYTKYYISEEDFLADVNNGITDFILSSYQFSKNGQLSLKAIDNILVKYSNRSNIHFHFEWDVLATQNKFFDLCHMFSQLNLDSFSTIRVQDYGAIEYLKECFPQVKLQLVLETAHHNLKALETLVNYLGKQCSRVVLPCELEKPLVQKYCTYLKKQELEIEMLGLGPILLFYSERKLLAPTVISEQTTVASATSEESPHKGFPLIENTHGTFMYNTKDLCLLDYVKELEEYGVNQLKIDLRQIDKSKQKIVSDSVISYQKDSFLENYPNPLIKGFYRANKTQVLFKKLKNQRLIRKGSDYIGEVIDVKKNNYVALQIKNKDNMTKLCLGQKIAILTPEGKNISANISKLQNSNGEEFNPDRSKNCSLVLINPIKGVSVRSQVNLSLLP